MTELYPINLLLVSLAAGITFYLGFLPLKDTPRQFFIQQSFATIVLWAVAAFVSGLHIGGYIIGCGLMATTAWRQFCFDREFIAKLWLSGAAAFGGILCLLLLVRVPPCPDGAGIWFMTSVYFGVFVMAATYMAAAISFTLTRTSTMPVIYMERALSFVFLAFAFRLILLAGILLGFPHMFPGWGGQLVEYLTHNRRGDFLSWIAYGLVVPIGVTAFAWYKLKKGTPPAELIWILALAFFSTLTGEFHARYFYM